MFFDVLFISLPSMPNTPFPLSRHPSASRVPRSSRAQFARAVLEQMVPRLILLGVDVAQAHTALLEVQRLHGLLRNGFRSDGR